MAGDRVEDYHRAVVVYDTLKRGGSLDTALDRMYAIHFDYSDLSSFERNGARRLIPFWTFLSRNLPLQVESIIREPRAYQRFSEARAALTQPDSELTPDYLRNGVTSVHLGDGKYLALDLPFADVDETLRAASNNPLAAVMQQAAPAIKVPIELHEGRQFWQGLPLSDDLAPMPETWNRIPGLSLALEKAGIVKRDRDGRPLISGSTSYAIEQYLPLLGRFRRLLPSTPKDQERATSSWLSFVGIGARTAGASTQTSEAWRRDEALGKLLAMLEAQGYETRVAAA